MPEQIIRKYQPQDRISVRDIAWNTALMGKSALAFFEDKEVFSDILTLYFTDYEPESCFVAESEDQVVGYLLGSKNVNLMGKKTLGLGVRVLLKIILRGTLFNKKNMQFAFRLIVSIFKGEFNDPRLAKDYPATLHINLREGWRDAGLGSKLISSYLEYLSRLGVKGVYLATMSDQASVFFSKQGFGLMHQAKRSYFRHILGKDINVYIYGKKLLGTAPCGDSP